MARLLGTARSDIELFYRQHPMNQNNNHYNDHYVFFCGGGFQSCPLIYYYLFYYFVHCSRFGPEKDLMMIFMNSIMGQNNGTLKAPIDGVNNKRRNSESQTSTKKDLAVAVEFKPL
jgi:hypothetical protein